MRVDPDATLNELRAWLRDEHGVSVSMGLMWNTLARLGLTLKKTSTPRNRRAPTLPRFAANGERCRVG